MDFSQNLLVVVFDTETTGLKSTDGHRVVDLGVQALLWNAGSQVFEEFGSNQWYFNPERASEAGAARVHRLSRKFLASMPTAAKQIPAISAWVDATTSRAFIKRGVSRVWLAAHNAIFDVAFCNGEVQGAGLDGTFACLLNASGVLCTKQFFKEVASGAGKLSQNAFCEWAGVDMAARHNAKGEEVHGALVDCQLLAQALIAAQAKLGTKAFAAACNTSLLDAASLASRESLGAAGFCKSKETAAKVGPAAAPSAAKGEKEDAMKSLRDKCHLAMQAFQQREEIRVGVDVFAHELQLLGVQLHQVCVDGTAGAVDTMYSDGATTLLGSALGEEFGVQALSKLAGFARLQRHMLPKETVQSKETAAEEAAKQALKDKCTGAMAEFVRGKRGGDIAAFEAALWKRGVRLRLNFADDYARFSGTSYTDGFQTLAGSAIGKEFTAKTLMEATGFQRLRHWPLVQHHLPLFERLRSMPLDALQTSVMAADKLPVLPLPDTDALACFELHRHFKRAAAVFKAMDAGEVQRGQVTEWLAGLRTNAATKYFADSVALFLNGFCFAASLHERGSTVREQLERIRQALDKGAAVSAKDEVAWLHQGAMLLCERTLPDLRKK